MNKYIKAVFCVPLAGIKYAILKIENGGRFHAAFPAIMSPMTEVTVDGKSELHIARKLKMHNGAKIRVRKGGKLEIGKNFGMSNGCVVTAYDHIKIGDNVMLIISCIQQYTVFFWLLEMHWREALEIVSLVNQRKKTMRICVIFSFCFHG